MCRTECAGLSVTLVCHTSSGKRSIFSPGSMPTSSTSPKYAHLNVTARCSKWYTEFHLKPSQNHGGTGLYQVTTPEPGASSSQKSVSQSELTSLPGRSTDSLSGTTLLPGGCAALGSAGSPSCCPAPSPAADPGRQGPTPRHRWATHLLRHIGSKHPKSRCGMAGHPKTPSTSRGTCHQANPRRASSGS